MAKKLQAERPYTLEKSGEGEVTMHFDMHRSPGGRPQGWVVLTFLMIPLGFIPGVLVSTVLWGNLDMAPIGWFISFIIPFIMSHRSYNAQGARGSQYTRMIFTRDEVETTSKVALDRTDCEEVWWRGADTSFTYNSNTSYKNGKAVANSKAKNGHHVGVTYGAKEVGLTHETLTKNQAQKITDAVARWMRDPDAFLAEAADAQKQAQTA